MAPNRREILVGALTTGTAIAAVPFVAKADAVSHSRRALAEVPLTDEEHWVKLDAEIQSWWGADIIRATENEIRGDTTKGVMFLPFPFLRIGVGAKGTYQWQNPVDSAFMIYALFAHERLDIVRGLLRNHIFMIERHGYAPNANNRDVLTRSQTPFFVVTAIWRYYLATKDIGFLYAAYPFLKQEYRHYWNAPHHQTPLGLSTNRDLGDPVLSPELASEAEVLDWTPVFGGDVRRCVPVGTNAGLVSYARVLALIAKEIGCGNEARGFDREADARTALIHKYCWDEEAGIFREYDYIAEKQLPYISEFAYWTLWTGVATPRQAERLVDNLHLLEKPYGLACTDKGYDDPHNESAYELRNSAPYRSLKDLPPMKDAPDEYVGGRNQLMWMYPAGWATTQIIVTGGLDAYGYAEVSRRVSKKFLSLLISQYHKTGRLWEKYNVVDGSLILPNARYGNIPYRSFTAAAVAILGRRVFRGQALQIT